MKFILSISLNIILLFVFTTMTTNSAWACGKNNHKKETQYSASKCQKECCKKPCSDSKNKKKGCCGDNNCNCPVSLTVMGDLPKLLSFDTIQSRPVFMAKRTFFFKQVLLKSSIQDIWQPPITVLFV